MTSEFDLIARCFARPAPDGMLGVGDDCALFAVPHGKHVATSTDLLLAGRHFFPDVDPHALGHKSLAVNLSDLAAMGAQPIGCLLGLALPSVDLPWVEAFARGFHALCDAHGCPLIGGDTTRAADGHVAISVTVFGAVDPQHALKRSGARVGDDIWVSGTLGAADAAYRLLSGQWDQDNALLAACRPALERPEPQVALGMALAPIAHAAIDISDGLLQDLGHILAASQVGATLHETDLPVDDSLAALPAVQVRGCVLGGGDVYQLCVTADPADRDRILQSARNIGVRITRVGSIVSQRGLRVLDAAGQPIGDLPGGFDHFAST